MSNHSFLVVFRYDEYYWCIQNVEEDSYRVKDVLDAHESAGVVGEAVLRAVRQIVTGQCKERDVSDTQQNMIISNSTK